MCRQLDAGQSTLLIEVIKRDLFIYLFICLFRRDCFPQILDLTKAKVAAS